MAGKNQDPVDSPQALVSVEKLKELLETTANRVAEKLVQAFGLEEKPEAQIPALPKEIEDAVNALAVYDDVKAGVRAELATKMTGEKTQSLWLKAYALKIEQGSVDTLARKFAWSLIQGEEAPKVETPAESAPAVSSDTPAPESKEDTVMASAAEGTKVQADVKQNKGEVSGFQSGESASSGPKGNVPSVPGRVITEGPALDVLPKPVKTGHETKTDYEAGAKASDKEIEALKRSKGLISEKSKLASVTEKIEAIASTPEGLKLVEGFIAFATKKASKKAPVGSWTAPKK